jgi:hypothetical protein
MTHAPRWSEVLRVAVRALGALLFLAAPTAGDIGSCTASPADLDPNKFFVDKQAIDCERCQECGFVTATCARACGAPMGGTFAPLCYPLVHDGEVCFDALLSASCGTYASYVSDEGSTVPTECDFCPAEDAGAP